MMACRLAAALSFQWSEVSGPAPVTFSNPAGGSTQAAFAVAGTYVLKLAVSDSQLTGSGTVSVLVNPAGTNQPPVVSITADNSAITLPTNSVTLTRSRHGRWPARRTYIYAMVAGKRSWYCQHYAAYVHLCQSCFPGGGRLYHQAHRQRWPAFRQRHDQYYGDDGRR